MNTEEKAKAYDEIRLKVEKYWESGEMSEDMRNYLFPEFAESKDEEIRKQIKAFIKSRGSHITQSKTDAWLAWLEKQGEQKQVEWNSDDEQYLLICKNALAKYQVSDKWDATIISRWLEKKLKSFYPQVKPVEWSEEDEERYKKIVRYIKSKGYEDDADWLDSFRPKEKKYILQGSYKTEWSEEDKKMLSLIIDEFDAIKFKSDTQLEKNIIDNKIDWLESLRPPYYCDSCKLKKSVTGWKPTEEQIKALQFLIEGSITSDLFILKELLKQLKEL